MDNWKERAGRLCALTCVPPGTRSLRHVLYDARAVDSMPHRIVRPRLKRQEIDGALFFSPRTAQTFVRILTMAGLDRATESVTAFCLSPAVAAAVSGLSWRGVEIAGPDRSRDLA